MINLLQKTTSAHSSESSPVSLSSSSNNTTNSVKYNSGHSGVFLIPPPTGELDNIDRGSLLLDSLNILSMVRSLELEKEKREKHKGKSLLAKKESKNDLQVKKYEFTKDMFHYINTEAFLHVTHLLFDTYDSKETENRFRNAWPIYDKKMEGVYRRVVLEWLKDIVEKNTSFFKGIKIESIGGLIVNPGGDRFIKFIHSLTTFVLHQVATRKQQMGYIKKPIVNYMECSSSTSIQVKNKQVYCLQKVCNQLMEDTFDAEKSLIKNTLQHRKLMEELQNRKHANESQFNENKLELLAKIKKNSSLFPDNAMDLFEKRKDYICKISSFEQLISGNVEPDPLCKVLKEEIEKKSSEAIGKLNDIKDFFNRHERLWYFLQMDKANPSVIDGSKLFKPDEGNQEYTSFNSFIASASTILSKFCENDNLWKPTDPGTREKLASYRQKYQLLQLRASDLRKTDGDLDMFTKNLDFEAKILSLKLNEIDWRYLSNSENVHSVSNLLTFTPAKVFDLNRTTGYSPALNTFLSNHFKDSFGTPNRAQMELRSEMRRDADSKLKTSIREYSLNQSNHRGNPVNTSRMTLLKSSPNNIRTNQNQTVVDSPCHNGSFKPNINESNFSSPHPANVSKVQTQLEPLQDSFLLRKDSFIFSGAGDDPLINFNTPERKSPQEPDAEARISRLLDSLKDSAIGDTKDCFLDDSGDGNSKLGNHSLLDDWESEKGLLDMSMSNVSFVNDDLL